MNCTICGLSAPDWRRLAAKMRDGAKLMVGQPDYEAYVAHRKARHSGQPIMTREEFFLERQMSRFGEGGGRAFRCC
jgi:uncharacterized short protein YbdD (DUF466 family)